MGGVNNYVVGIFGIFGIFGIIGIIGIIGHIYNLYPFNAVLLIVENWKIIIDKVCPLCGAQFVCIVE